MRAGVYLRISSDPEGLRAGVDRQRQDCLAECERRGWETAVYEDNDVSAYSGKPRPAYEQMMTDAEAGLIRAVVAWAPDRLHRHPKELETFISAVDRLKLAVYTLQGGEWNLNTPEGRFQAALMGRVARLESEKTAARIQRARLEEAKQGRPMMGGPRPWGFAPNRIDHDPVEAEEVRDAAVRLLAGESPRSVAKRYGLQPFNMWRALVAPRMIGIREHQGIRHAAQWAPILDVDVWEALRALQKRRQDASTDPGGQRARTHLLSGFLRCGICGSRVNGAPTSRKIGPKDSKERVAVPGYRCMAINCGNVRRAAAPLDSYITEWVLQRAELPAAPTVDPALAAAVHVAQTLLDGLWDLYEQQVISAAEFATKRRQYEQQLSEAQAALAEATADNPSGLVSTMGDTEILGAVWDWWTNADLRQRRELIGRHVDQIILRPARRGRRFDADSVEIIPKQRN